MFGDGDESSGQVHLALYDDASSRPAYIVAALSALAAGSEATRRARTNLLAVALLRHDDALLHALWTRHAALFGVTEMLRACQLLDGQRQLRALAPRLERVRKAALKAKLRSRIAEITDAQPFGTLSGATRKWVVRWVETFVSPESLRDLIFTTNEALWRPWRLLADLVHLKPSSFREPLFARVVIAGEAAGADTAVGRFAQLVDKNGKHVVGQLCELRVPYVAIRNAAVELGLVVDFLPRELKRAVAQYESVATLLWYFEELECDEVDERIASLLEQGSNPGFGFGKLLERAMVLPPRSREAVLRAARLGTRAHSSGAYTSCCNSWRLVRIFFFLFFFFCFFLSFHFFFLFLFSFLFLFFSLILFSFFLLFFINFFFVSLSFFFSSNSIFSLSHSSDSMDVCFAHFQYCVGVDHKTVAQCRASLVQ